MTAFLKRLLAIFAMPRGWTGVPIYAPPLIIPAASPLWREALPDEGGPTNEPPAPEAAAEPARRPHLRLVSSNLKEA